MSACILPPRDVSCRGHLMLQGREVVMLRRHMVVVLRLSHAVQGRPEPRRHRGLQRRFLLQVMAVSLHLESGMLTSHAGGLRSNFIRAQELAPCNHVNSGLNVNVCSWSVMHTRSASQEYSGAADTM